jgi:hypothetical protein
MEISSESKSPRGRRRNPRTVLVPPLPFAAAASQDAMEAANAGSTQTGLPPSPVTHVGPAPLAPARVAMGTPSPDEPVVVARLAAGTPPPIPALDTAPYPKRQEDSVEIEIDVELEPPAPMDVDFTEPTERVDIETIDVDHLDPIEHTDPGGRQGPRLRRPRVTNAGVGTPRVEVTRIGVAPTSRVARHVEKKRGTLPTPPPPVRAGGDEPALPPVRAGGDEPALPPVRAGGDETVPYPKGAAPAATHVAATHVRDDDPATVKFTRPYDRYELDVAKESETPHVVREISAPMNLVHETQAVPKQRDSQSAPYETLEIAAMRTDQILRQCERRANPVWRWAIAGLILGAGAFACGLSLAHLILR